MKGVILAAGKGSRVRRVTNGNSKCLLMVGNESIIMHNVKSLCKLKEIEECIIVVGYESETIIEHIGDCCYGKRIRYCFQKEQKGLINALESAIDEIGTDDFFMVLGDEYIISDNYVDAIGNFTMNNVDCMIGIIKADKIDDVKKTYTFLIDSENKMHSFIEKPDVPYNNLMGTGNVICKNLILSYLQKIPINMIRGEKELVDLFNLLVIDHKEPESFWVGKEYFNVNTEEEYLKLCKKLLN